MRENWHGPEKGKAMVTGDNPHKDRVRHGFCTSLYSANLTSLMPDPREFCSLN